MAAQRPNQRPNQRPSQLFRNLNAKIASIPMVLTAVVVFLVWIYLSAVILLYGVEVTAAYARLRSGATT